MTNALAIIVHTDKISEMCAIIQRSASDCIAWFKDNRVEIFVCLPVKRMQFVEEQFDRLKIHIQKVIDSPTFGRISICGYFPEYEIKKVAKRYNWFKPATE